LEILAHTLPEAAHAEPARLPALAPRVVEMLDRTFAVSADDAACPREPEWKVALEPEASALRLDVRYRCPAEPEVLVLDSTLFNDDASPHQVVGTLRHLRAKIG